MFLEVLVEEPSAEVALKLLLPQILGDEVKFRILAHQDKLHLLKSLPNTLRGYRHWLPDNYWLIVLIDEDRDDCHKLKQKLEDIALKAGLSTKTNPDGDGNFSVINRIVIEELEAWFFGDIPALVEAFPRVPETLDRRQSYRDPDAIRGGTWEALERVLREGGYYKNGLAKIDAARKIAEYMDPDRNRSKSFQVFRDALRTLQ